MINGTDYTAILYSAGSTDNAPQGAAKMNQNFDDIQFCNPVASFAALPASGNTDGDVRKVLDTGKEYMYKSSAWNDFNKYLNLSELDAALTAGTSTTLDNTYNSFTPYIKLEVKDKGIANQHISDTAAIAWAKLSKAGSNLTDLSTKNHNDTDSLQGGTTSEYYHLTNSDYLALRGGSTNADSLHKHTHYLYDRISGGVLTTGNNKQGWLMNDAGTFKKVRLYANGAPTGAAIEIDVNLNGSSIFSSPITIAIGASSGYTITFATTTFAENDLITYDVDQVGSTYAGGDAFYITISWE